MKAARTANLVLAFLLELAALAAVAAWGVHVGPTRIARIAIATAGVVAWATIWGLCFSPRARVQLPPLAKQWGQVTMFSIAVVALGATGRPAEAIGFAAVAATNRVLIAVWHQEDAQHETANGTQ